jgi:signal peptidase II
MRAAGPAPAQTRAGMIAAARKKRTEKTHRISAPKKRIGYPHRKNAPKKRTDTRMRGQAVLPPVNEMIIWLVVLAAAVAADQLTKYLVDSGMEVGGSVDLIPGVLRLTYVRNEGAAFGMLAEHRWVFIVLSLLTIAGIVYYVVRYRPRSAWMMCSLTLVTAGGIGNMIDRLSLGYVIDFVDFYAFGELWKWVFNVADACVCVGAFLLALKLLTDTVRESRAAKAGKDEGENG